MQTNTLIAAGLLTLSFTGPSFALSEIAEQCELALQSGDRSVFEAVVEAVRPRKDVFDTEVRKRVEQCLSEGFGEPWAYSFPDSAWLSVSEADARAKARRGSKLEEKRAAADAESQRKANIERVATMVYASCAELLGRDQVAAMTNELCVETFLTNGLPTVP